MNAERLLEVYEQISEAPGAIARLRRFVLDLAVRGKLVEQRTSDEPAFQLLERIERRKAEILQHTGMRKPRSVADMDPAETWADLPANWVWTQISDLGFVSPRNEADDHVEASFVPMPMIFAEYGVANGHEVRPWGKIKKGYTHFAEGDVGLAKITPCFENGKSTVFRNLTGGFGSGTTELHILRPILVDPDYVVLFLKSPQFIETGISEMTGTAGQKRVSSGYFTSSPFPLPPLAEQHRIVAKIDELMALCDRLEEAETSPAHAAFALEALPALTTRPDQIKTLRQTILHLAVRGKLVEQDPAEEPGSALLSRIHERKKKVVQPQEMKRAEQFSVEENDFPFEVPKNWTWAALRQLSYNLGDGLHGTPSYIADGQIYFVNGTNLRDGKIQIFENTKRVSKEEWQKHAKPLSERSMLVSINGTLSNYAFYNGEQVLLGKSACYFEISPLVNMGFIRLLVQSPYYTDYATTRATGTTIRNLSLKAMNSLPVPLPPLAEQHRIVAKVDALLALCDRLEAALTTTDTIRTRLLEALLHEALAPTSAVLEAAE